MEILSGRKKEGTFNAVKDYAFRNVFIAHAISAGRFRLAVWGNKSNMRDRLHLAEEENDSHNHPGAYADRKIEYNGKPKGGRHDGEVCSRAAPEFYECMCFR